MKISFVYSTHSDNVQTRCRQRPRVDSRFADPPNQGNDIIILLKFEIQLILHNNSRNEYLSTINYSRMHKITKIPLHAKITKITKMPPTSLFY